MLLKAGHDYIGVGVGAMVFDNEGLVFLSQRGPLAKNERGCWEFPGGSVEYGERLEDAIMREFAEEYGMQIGELCLLHVVDHILPEEGQHWISPTYLARHLGGEPMIREVGKCSAIGWFLIDDLPTPLSQVSIEDVRVFRETVKPQ
jgi:8-oxo-dGTP diphosphatase